VARSKLYAQDPHILSASLHNILAWATKHLGLVQPWCKLSNQKEVCVQSNFNECANGNKANRKQTGAVLMPNMIPNVF
jgi:hypothetical protein